MDFDILFYSLLSLMAVATIITLVILKRRGKLDETKITKYLVITETLCRKAEAMWQDFKGAGAAKKAWVLEHLKTSVENYNSDTMGKLVDSMVALLNENSWVK